MNNEDSKTEDTLMQGFRVKDLIKQLEGCDPDMFVVFAYPYGDRGRNQVAGIIESIDEKHVSWSNYHNALKVPEIDDLAQDSVEVLVIE